MKRPAVWSFYDLCLFLVTFGLVLAVVSAMVGCAGSAQDAGPTCTLEGDYRVTVEGCGATSVTTRSMDFPTACRGNDVCEPGKPAAFCAFVSEFEGCDVWTTFERVEPAAVAPEPEIPLCPGASPPGPFDCQRLWFKPGIGYCNEYFRCTTL